MSGPDSSAGRPDAGIVLYLGMVRRGEYESLLDHGLRLGVLVDVNSRQRLADVSKFAVVDQFDFSRPVEDLIAAVRSIAARTPVSCLFNVIEFYVEQTAAVAAALGLRSVSATSAALCLDKISMRRRFHECVGPGAAARFHVVATERELVERAEQLGYPVFLQPSNVSASMWSTCNQDAGELRANFRRMVEEVPAYYQRLGQPAKRLSAVVAQFLDGENTSIDCLVDAHGTVATTPVVDVLTGRDVGIDDFHHFARVLPSRLDEPAQQDLARLAAEGVRVLEMRNAAAHVEFIGNKIGEIAARPGGNRPRILELAYGIEELFAYYQVLCGQSPDLTKRRNRAAAIVTPFPARQGTLREIHGLERVRELPGYLYHEVRAQPGQMVGLAKFGFRAPLYIELASEEEQAVRGSVDAVASWSDLYMVD